MEEGALGLPLNDRDIGYRMAGQARRKVGKGGQEWPRTLYKEGIGEQHKGGREEEGLG